MLMVISPAKTLDFESSSPVSEFSQPQYLEHAQVLIEECRKLSPAQLASLMSISDKLAGLNAARFAQWQQPFTPENAKQSILAFKGDVYTGLDAETFVDQDFTFAQRHLRILSGLYGMLRPLDLMQPYRLEMGTRLVNPEGKDLYAFWKAFLTREMSKALLAQGDDCLINLASNEYFKALDSKALRGRIITPVFKDYKNGQYKIISFYAKKARGLMTRYVIDHRLTDPEAIKGFDRQGYQFSEADSDATTWVFLRDQPPA